LNRFAKKEGKSYLQKDFKDDLYDLHDKTNIESIFVSAPAHKSETFADVILVLN